MDEVARLSVSINALLDRLETASRTERRFLSDAAHELRTPLTVLRTGLEVELNRGRSPEELRQALQSALRVTVALCASADELLAIARLGDEAFVQRAPVDMSELMHEVIEAVEPLTDARHLTVDAKTEVRVVVDGNRDHLRRLLVNLLDNAIKFAPENGRIAATLERNGNRAILRVCDNGPGIPPEDLPFVFERFFRGAGHKTAGSGLGLSLCREIVRLHHGEISACNNPGGGAAVTVKLPLHAQS